MFNFVLQLGIKLMSVRSIIDKIQAAKNLIGLLRRSKQPSDYTLDEGTVSKWKSESFIASLVTIIVSVAGLLGYYFDDAFANDLTATVLSSITAVAGLIALVGRATATKRIK